jgi:hypothetical protein
LKYAQYIGVPVASHLCHPVNAYRSVLVNKLVISTPRACIGGIIEQGVIMKQDCNEIVSLAMEGDRHALESLIRSVQDRIYHLALKMLCHRVDAEDATQEILI